MNSLHNESYLNDFKPIQKCHNDCSSSGSKKIIDLLESARDIYIMLINDVCRYAKLLNSLQEYFKIKEIDDDFIIDIIKYKLKKNTESFYWSFVGHLSITTNVAGIGDKVIKPVNCINGTITTIKYQNVSKNCSECISRKKKINEHNINNGIYKLNDYLNVQKPLIVATYDNVSIDHIYNDDLLVGYEIKIGKLTYEIYFISDCLLSDKITNRSLKNIYDFVHSMAKTLADLEYSLQINTNYIKKNIHKILS